MADTCALMGLSGTESLDSQDNVTLVYRAIYDGAAPTNFYAALSRARAVGLPARRSLYSSPSSILVATGFAASISEPNKKRVWDWSVTYGPPPQSEGGNGEVSIIENPLERPPVFNVEYMDIEKVIDQARNVETLAHGDGKGGERAANTEGPIVNAAGKRPDEPQMTSDRLEVLVIQKNYASLADIVNRNRTFKRTTNSGGIQGYGARELRYLLTESSGVQNENGYVFWPGVTKILAEPTTDLILDNVGYDYWDAVAEDWKRVLDADSQPVAEPINLKLDGDRGGDESTTITYRYLEAVGYGDLFE